MNNPREGYKNRIYLFRLINFHLINHLHPIH